MDRECWWATVNEVAKKWDMTEQLNKQQKTKTFKWASLVAQMVKAPVCNAGDPGSIPGSGRSPEKEMATTPVLLPGKFHGWRNLVGYSPWGHKESDTTE